MTSPGNDTFHVDNGLPADKSFHVDLRGLVDLLSHHLYSSPRVYLRELMQNALDAITARAELEPGCPREVEIVPADVCADGCLHLLDTGIGLDEEGIRTVLATIGASSKRDELGFARESYLGQFGIGLLSCFLVADEIRLLTRAALVPGSAEGPTREAGAEHPVGGVGERVQSPQTWSWIGRADGTYAVSPAPEDQRRAAPGTEVILAPRAGSAAAALLGQEAVMALVSQYAAYLPVTITVHTKDGPIRLGDRQFPWERTGVGGPERQRDARALAQQVLGFEPLDAIELADPVAGIRGFAFVTPVPAGTRAAHRVYARRMLVGETVAGILPEWAFFVRAVLDGERLDLTASREALQDDEALAETRERLGAALRRWLLRTAATDPQRMRRFLAVHALGAKAMAAEDDEMLDIVAGLLTWETTRGEMSLTDFTALAREQGGPLTYAESIEDFRQIAPLAQVLDLAVLNAGYAYDGPILRRWLTRHPELDTRRLAPSELTARFEEPSAAQSAAYQGLVEIADEVLARAGVQTQVRHFAPLELHAVLLVDRASRQERDRAQVREDVGDLDGPWAALLDGSARPTARAAFVLNAGNLAVCRLAGSRDRDLQRLVIEALYAHALVAGHHPLRAFDSALVARALPALIDRTLDQAIDQAIDPKGGATTDSAEGRLP